MPEVSLLGDHQTVGAQQALRAGHLLQRIQAAEAAAKAAFQVSGVVQVRQANEKIFELIIAENFPNMGKEIVNQVQEAQSPSQCKPNEEHIKTHNNQTDKN